MNSNAFKVNVAFLSICILWGTTWVAIKFSLLSLTPFISAGYRFILAALIIYLLMWVKKLNLQTDSVSVKLYLLMAFFSFVIPFGLVYWGQQFVPSGLASVLFSVYPFFVAIFTGFFIPDEEIGIIKIIGMIIGFGGIITIFSKNIDLDFGSYFEGMLAVLLSGIMQAAIAVTLKKYGHHLNPLSMNFIPMVIAGIIMLLGGYLIEDISKLKYDLNAVLSVSYLGFFGSVVTFTAYYWLLKRVNIILLSLIAFITPIIALLVGWILFDEKLLVHQIYGSLLVLLGVFTANVGPLLKRNKFLERH